MIPLSHFVRLSPWQRKLTLLSLGYLLYAKYGTRWMTSKRLLQLGNTPSAQSLPIAAARMSFARQCIQALDRASRFSHVTNCLQRGTALRLLLAHYRIPSTLHMGVRKVEDGALGAHAWVSIDDEVILGGKEMTAGYVPLARRTPARINSRIPEDAGDQITSC